MKTGVKEKKGKKKATIIYLNKEVKSTPPDRSKFFGSIKSDIDPVVHQRKLRDEWD